MSKINIRSFSNENDDGAPDIVGVSTFSSTAYFVPTKGNTAQKPSDHVEVGSIRFNTDTSNLEFYRGHGVGWSQFELIDPELGGGTGSNTGLGTRGIIGGFNVSGNVIEFLTVSSLGNTQDFGDLSTGRNFQAQNCCNRSRMIFGGGYNGTGWVNIIDFITVSSLGNSTDFGDVTEKRVKTCGVNNNTRGIFCGGHHAPDYSGSNVIDYVTIAQTGNAVDFGDIVNAVSTNSSASSSTRGVLTKSVISPSPISTMDFITMASIGNAADFGNLSVNQLHAGGSSSTRGIFAGGYITNVIEFITMATTGNSQDFGDLTVNRFGGRGLSSPTRDVIVGSRITPGSANTNVIDYVEIATTGNAVDFGDITTIGDQLGYAGNSNGHGGL